MAEPNVLLLDEPTNDLDTDTLAALEDLLDSWAGTLVVVSHDRYLVERVCDSVVALLGDGRLAALPGGIEEYLARRRAAREAEAGGGATGGTGRRAQGDTRADARAARRELIRLERRIATLEKQEAQLHDRAGRARHRPRPGRPSWTPSCGRSRPRRTRPSRPGWSWRRPPEADRRRSVGLSGHGWRRPR